MSRSRGGKGRAVRGPLREITVILEPAREGSARRTARLSCGHVIAIASHSTKQARCSVCLQVAIDADLAPSTNKED